ncbi:MAG: hypothetical protein JRJ03_11480 [Deltaproteobacteria bacterium]|nr:hypothetical protein [Deltaproteobacteria bacterium]
MGFYGAFYRYLDRDYFLSRKSKSLIGNSCLPIPLEEAENFFRGIIEAFKPLMIVDLYVTVSNGIEQ